MAVGKLTLLISAILLLAAVSFAAPAEKDLLAPEPVPVKRLADEKGDLKPAASHWGGWGHGGYGGYGGYGHWGGGYYPYWGSSYYGWPSYSYGYGYGGWPYYGYGHHGLWW